MIRSERFERHCLYLPDECICKLSLESLRHSHRDRHAEQHPRQMQLRPLMTCGMVAIIGADTVHASSETNHLNQAIN